MSPLLQVEKLNPERASHVSKITQQADQWQSWKLDVTELIS